MQEHAAVTNPSGAKAKAPNEPAHTLGTTAQNDLGVVYQELQGRLRNYLRKRVDERWVDDIVQDIFEKAIKAQKQGRPVQNLTAWLFTISRNAVADHYRKKSVPVVELNEDLEVHEADQADLEHSLLNCLEPLTKRLPDKYRSTILATDFQGRNMKSVAQEMGLTVSGVKSRASRARKMLRQEFVLCCGVGVCASVSCGNGCRGACV
jgi:RNA polymerase sigma-70 factor (ECF subfamily)